jgi:glycosyltransferase involved in cell wall biosynthesis
VIIVNDGSGDNTAAMLQELCSRYAPRLRVISHAHNRGYGAALRSGFQAARYDLVFYTDGDGQYDVTELPLLLERLGPDVGLVNGYKIKRHDPFYRVVIGWLYNGLIRILFGIRLRDVNCDFRLLRGELAQALDIESDSGTVCLELVRKIESSPWRVVEVGVHHYPRRHGRSQFFRFRALLDTSRQLPRLFWKLAIRRPRWAKRKSTHERLA